MNSSQTTLTEQPPAAESTTANGAPIVFLGVGVVINLLLVTAYLIWARKQWKKTGRKDE